MNFVIFGAAAYVAPRHMQAITALGHSITAVLDPYDNVGILDRFTPDCQYFSNFERFDRHISKESRRNQGPEWVSVCTPNWLHDSHCMTGLRWGANVICEKPLVLSPTNLDELQFEEELTGKRVFTVLQLRHHEEVKRLRTSLDPARTYDITLTYITGRGPWFVQSWKGQEWSSGGTIFNIGIHFLDLLVWLFGEPQIVEVHHRDVQRVCGYLELARARVRWYLSTAMEDLPENANGTTYRSLSIGDQEIDLSHGFENLHTIVYRETLAGRGLGIEDARPSIELAHTISRAEPCMSNIQLAHELTTNLQKE